MTHSKIPDELPSYLAWVDNVVSCILTADLTFTGDKIKALVTKGGNVTVRFKFATDDGPIAFTYLTTTKEFVSGDSTSVTINNIYSTKDYKFEAKTLNQTSVWAFKAEVHCKLLLLFINIPFI